MTFSVISIPSLVGSPCFLFYSVHLHRVDPSCSIDRLVDVSRFRGLILAEPFHESLVKQCVSDVGSYEYELVQAFIFIDT